MTKQRYMIFDSETGRYLKYVLIPDPDTPDVFETRWTKDKGRAEKFPGIKSAKRILERIVGGSYGALSIMNSRGWVIQ